jgi:hypothetical protein
MPRTKTRKPRARYAHEPARDEGEVSFGTICSELRASLHTTQAQLGEWFAVSGKTFARWEAGSAFPSKLPWGRPLGFAGSGNLAKFVESGHCSLS